MDVTFAVHRCYIVLTLLLHWFHMLDFLVMDFTSVSNCFHIRVNLNYFELILYSYLLCCDS